jgi:hypothetical protein
LSVTRAEGNDEASAWNHSWNRLMGMIKVQREKAEAPNPHE